MAVEQSDIDVLWNYVYTLASIVMEVEELVIDNKIRRIALQNLDMIDMNVLQEEMTRELEAVKKIPYIVELKQRHAAHLAALEVHEHHKLEEEPL